MTTRMTEHTLAERLNRLPVLTRLHKVWGVLVTALLVFEMADLNAFAYVAPTLRKQWGISVDQVAWISASAFLGMAAGSLVGGWLADRFGRQRLLMFGTLFYSVLSILSATSTGPLQLGIYRFFIGAGLYAVTVAALTYVSEMFPRMHRGKVQSLAAAVAFLGIPLMSLFSRWVIPMGDNSWRWVFVFGGFGMAISLVAWRMLPESIRWREQNDKDTESAADLVAMLETEATRQTGSPLPVPTPEPVVQAGKAADLVRGGFLRRTVVMSSVLIFATSAFYGFNSWLPLLLGEHGFSTTASLNYTTIVALAACPGALLASVLIERFERRTTVMVVFLACALFLLLVGFTDNDVLFLIGGVMVSFLLYCATAILYTYMPEIFPTQLRALGTGIPNSGGRIATVFCMFVVAEILKQMGFTSVFVYLAVSVGIAGTILGVFGERTRGRSLESIAAGAKTAPVTDLGEQIRAGHTTAPKV
ncbi:MFS transporter [Gordonia terrae]|uniref:MFS transporter n=1 Tax=Gordonia terrae TaxID=2055 RepID=UPI003F6C6C2C